MQYRIKMGNDFYLVRIGTDTNNYCIEKDNAVEPVRENSITVTPLGNDRYQIHFNHLSERALYLMNQGRLLLCVSCYNSGRPGSSSVGYGYTEFTYHNRRHCAAGYKINNLNDMIIDLSDAALLDTFTRRIYMYAQLHHNPYRDNVYAEFTFVLANGHVNSRHQCNEGGFRVIYSFSKEIGFFTKTYY